MFKQGKGFIPLTRKRQQQMDIDYPKISRFRLLRLLLVCFVYLNCCQRKIGTKIIVNVDINLFHFISVPNSNIEFL